MSKKKKTAIAALIVLGIVAVGLAAGVYAKYIASLTKTGGAEIAKWAFESDNTSSTIECSITSTVQSGAIKASTTDKPIIAPGTSGKCDIQVANTTSEVKVKYTISLADDGLVNAPKNLKLNGSAASSFAGVTDYLAMGASKTESITWDWPYETGDAADGVVPGDEDDTNDGEAGEDMTIKFKITGVQVNPATGV